MSTEKKIECTEQELWVQIETLKKQAEELSKKAKNMEEQNKDTEFNKQRYYLINKVRDFLGIEVSDEEVLAFLYHYSCYGNEPVKYYLKQEDQNLLFERKVANRYARYHEIRCEDSLAIFQNFLKKINPLNDPIVFAQKENQQEREHQIKGKQYVREKYIPLFC